jgi:hypothetical protein
MTFSKLYPVAGLIAGALLLLANSTNPPNGKTGAPGENFCTECHTPSATTLGGFITVDGFPATIEPNQTYQLTVTNQDTSGAGVKAGFQMTILGPLNTKAGDMKNPSASSTVANAQGRQYFEHNPASTYPITRSVSWTVDWTAPDLAPGSVVTWYAVGNIANGNFSDSGDKIVAANGTGTYMLSSVAGPVTPEVLSLYPNPGNDNLWIDLPASLGPESRVTFYTAEGRIASRTTARSGRLDVAHLPAGLYIVRVEDGRTAAQARWIKH